MFAVLPYCRPLLFRYCLHEIEIGSFTVDVAIKFVLYKSLFHEDEMFFVSVIASHSFICVIRQHSCRLVVESEAKALWVACVFAKKLSISAPHIHQNVAQ